MNNIEKLKDALDKFDRSKCELPDWIVNAMIAQIESVVEDAEKEKLCDEFPLEKELVDDYFSSLKRGDVVYGLSCEEAKRRSDIADLSSCYFGHSYIFYQYLDSFVHTITKEGRYKNACVSLHQRTDFKIPQSFVDEWRKEHKAEKAIIVKSEEFSNNDGIFRYECYCESKGASFNEFCKRISLVIGDLKC